MLLAVLSHVSVVDTSAQGKRIYVLAKLDTDMRLDLRKQGMWAQTTPCHITDHISVVEQNIFIP